MEDSDVDFMLTEHEMAGTILNIHRKRQFKTLFSTDPSPGFVCVQDFEGEDGGHFQEPRIEDTKKHIMLCVYTSGTTGLRKGAEISMYAFIAASEVHRGSQFFKECDVVLGWNPVAHASGFVVAMTAFISAAVVVPSKRGLSPKEFVEVVNKHKVTALVAFPTEFRKLAFNLEEGMVPSLQRIIIVGSIWTEDLYRQILQVFRPESLRNAYGMTESIGHITITAPNTVGYRSAGFPLPMVEYKVVDNATGRHLGPGEVGEIVFRAPHIMNGYYKQQDVTAQVLNEEGWFRSERTASQSHLHGGVFFVEHIPKTYTGKYQKRKLRERHLRLIKESNGP